MAGRRDAGTGPEAAARPPAWVLGFFSCCSREALPLVGDGCPLLMRIPVCVDKPCHGNLCLHFRSPTPPLRSRAANTLRLGLWNCFRGGVAGGHPCNVPLPSASLRTVCALQCKLLRLFLGFVYLVSLT